MTCYGVGYTQVVENKMDSSQYVRYWLIVFREPWKSKGRIGKKSSSGMTTNLKHTSSMTNNCLKDQESEVMKWPAQFQDINPIEHLWNDLKRELSKSKESSQ